MGTLRRITLEGDRGRVMFATSRGEVA